MKELEIAKARVSSLETQLYMAKRYVEHVTGKMRREILGNLAEKSMDAEGKHLKGGEGNSVRMPGGTPGTPASDEDLSGDKSSLTLPAMWAAAKKKKQEQAGKHEENVKAEEKQEEDVEPVRFPGKRDTPPEGTPVERLPEFCPVCTRVKAKVSRGVYQHVALCPNDTKARKAAASAAEGAGGAGPQGGGPPVAEAAPGADQAAVGAEAAPSGGAAAPVAAHAEAPPRAGEAEARAAAAKGQARGQKRAAPEAEGAPRPRRAYTRAPADVPCTLCWRKAEGLPRGPYKCKCVGA